MISTASQEAPFASPAVHANSFFSELALLLGLPLSSASAMAAPATFTGPAGLVCRLQVQQHGERIEVRPEVLLPMAAEELAGAEVTRLLAMQAVLFNDGRWHLGVGPEGLLQLNALSMIDSPPHAAAALDIGSAIGLHVLRSLLDEEASP